MLWVSKNSILAGLPPCVFVLPWRWGSGRMSKPGFAPGSNIRPFSDPTFHS